MKSEDNALKKRQQMLDENNDEIDEIISNMGVYKVKCVKSSVVKMKLPFDNCAECLEKSLAHKSSSDQTSMINVILVLEQKRRYFGDITEYMKL